MGRPSGVGLACAYAKQQVICHREHFALQGVVYNVRLRCERKTGRTCRRHLGIDQRSPAVDDRMGNGGSAHLAALFGHPDVLGRRCVSDGGQRLSEFAKLRRRTAGSYWNDTGPALSATRRRRWPSRASVLRPLFCLFPCGFLIKFRIDTYRRCRSSSRCSRSTLPFRCSRRRRHRAGEVVQGSGLTFWSSGWSHFFRSRHSTTFLQLESSPSAVCPVQ